MSGNIEIYKTKTGKTEISVKLENETVWLTQKQMSELFDTTPQNITIHLKGIFEEGELNEDATCKDFLQVQIEGIRKVKRRQKHYNLDAVISVGYRVRSKVATQFRIWANQVLKDHLIQGYTLNNNRLLQLDNYNNLKNSVKLLDNILAKYEDLDNNQANGLLKVISAYTRGLDILDDYDNQKLEVRNITKEEKFNLTEDKAYNAIATIKMRFGGGSFVGAEKDQSFKSSINSLYQTFGGKELYPSVEEKAANLLYFVTKNHSFIDGNKRIAAALFTWYLEENNLLFNKDGTKILEDNALVALTLMIAESQSSEKDTMTKVITSLINRENSRDFIPDNADE
jgi:prophage maintenance system killer protein